MFAYITGFRTFWITFHKDFSNMSSDSFIVADAASVFHVPAEFCMRFRVRLECHDERSCSRISQCVLPYVGTDIKCDRSRTNMGQNLGNELFLGIFWCSGRAAGQDNLTLIEHIQDFEYSFMIVENLSFFKLRLRFETRYKSCLRLVPKESNRILIP